MRGGFFRADYLSINDGGTPRANYNNDGATGMFALATGAVASAAGPEATAIGYQTVASGENSTAIGNQVTAAAAGSIAIGGNGAMKMSVDAASLYGIAIGYNSSVINAPNGIAIGLSSSAGGHNAAAFGVGANATGPAAIALGQNSVASASWGGGARPRRDGIG